MELLQKIIVGIVIYIALPAAVIYLFEYRIRRRGNSPNIAYKQSVLTSTTSTVVPAVILFVFSLINGMVKRAGYDEKPLGENYARNMVLMLCGIVLLYVVSYFFSRKLLFKRTK